MSATNVARALLRSNGTTVLLSPSVCVAHRLLPTALRPASCADTAPTQSERVSGWGQAWGHQQRGTSSSSSSLSTEVPVAAKVGRLNHVAIAVPDLTAASELYRSVFGAKVSAPQALPAHGVTVVFVELENVKLELLQPLGDASPIAGFLAKNPSGGMHHLCLEVPDVKTSIQHVKKSVRTLTDEPKIGAHDKPVVFLHPKDCNGVLTELEEA